MDLNTVAYFAYNLKNNAFHKLVNTIFCKFKEDVSEF